MLREERGSAPGSLQEEAGPPLVREFFKDTGMDEKMLERICYLVGHHHTFRNVDALIDIMNQIQSRNSNILIGFTKENKEAYKQMKASLNK